MTASLCCWWSVSNGGPTVPLAERPVRRRLPSHQSTAERCRRAKGCFLDATWVGAALQVRVRRSRRAAPCTHRTHDTIAPLPSPRPARDSPRRGGRPLHAATAAGGAILAAAAAGAIVPPVSLVFRGAAAPADAARGWKRNVAIDRSGCRRWCCGCDAAAAAQAAGGARVVCVADRRARERAVARASIAARALYGARPAQLTPYPRRPPAGDGPPGPGPTRTEGHISPNIVTNRTDYWASFGLWRGPERGLLAGRCRCAGVGAAACAAHRCSRAARRAAEPARGAWPQRFDAMVVVVVVARVQELGMRSGHLLADGSRVPTCEYKWRSCRPDQPDTSSDCNAAGCVRGTSADSVGGV
eukprot:scaffold1031_cov461-Prasinococcus_capsulatus_cf.AAC.5